MHSPSESKPKKRGVQAKSDSATKQQHKNRNNTTTTTTHGEECVNENENKNNKNSTNRLQQPELSPMKPCSGSGSGSGSGSVRNEDVNNVEEEEPPLVLWRQPFQTLYYSMLELSILLRKFLNENLLKRRMLLFLPWIAAFIITLIIAYITAGPHHLLFDKILAYTFFIMYWITLGFLSSAGLGSGLHTFVLYLAPHIARVTLAAAKCGTLKFPTPPYPDDVICPEEPYERTECSVWAIISKVRQESILWGLGTALGELPPYFVARAKRLSSTNNVSDDDEDDDEELAKLNALECAKDNNLSLMDCLKLKMKYAVERVGFLGILLCASIPNPAFDLAGITCGYFLVPFWTFFGATFLGKAIIKTHIQMLFVIFSLNETFIAVFANILAEIPLLGAKLEKIFLSFVRKQSKSENALSKVFDTLVILVVLYFVITILNTLAESYRKRMRKQKQKLRIKTKPTLAQNSTTKIKATNSCLRK